MIDPSHMRILQKHSIHILIPSNWMWQNIYMSIGGVNKIGHKGGIKRVPPQSSLQHAHLIFVITLLHSLGNGFANFFLTVVPPMFSLFHHLPPHKYILDVSRATILVTTTGASWTLLITSTTVCVIVVVTSGLVCIYMEMIYSKDISIHEHMLQIHNTYK
jgi:hypothetical protein